MDNSQWDVVIIGGGASGLSAALMLGRARRRVVVVDAEQPRNRFAAHMHGVLGNEGIDPAVLLERGRGEVRGYGVEFATGVVERVDEADAGVNVTLADGSRLTSRALIVATGVSDDLPAIPGLAERWGTSVLHCPYCHGWEVRDQHLGVVATSPAAVHQAQMVRQWSDRVTVFSAGMGEFEPGIEDRLRARGIALVPSPVTHILGEGSDISAVRTADGVDTHVDAIFTFGVLRPHDRFLGGLDLDRTDWPMGSFLTVDPMGKTSSDRIWAIGNVVNPMATVPMAMGAGSLAGPSVNALLVTEDFDAAVASMAA